MTQGVTSIAYWAVLKDPDFHFSDNPSFWLKSSLWHGGAFIPLAVEQLTFPYEYDMTSILAMVVFMTVYLTFEAIFSIQTGFDTYFWLPWNKYGI